MSSGYSYSVEPATVPQAPNPNPYRFEIKRRYVRGDYVALEVNYDGCTTYEGRKIIVWEGVKDLAITEACKHLDPHFMEDSGVLARFEPTGRGWQLAMDLVDRLSD